MRFSFLLDKFRLQSVLYFNFIKNYIGLTKILIISNRLYYGSLYIFAPPVDIGVI